MAAPDWDKVAPSFQPQSFTILLIHSVFSLATIPALLIKTQTPGDPFVTTINTLNMILLQQLPCLFFIIIFILSLSPHFHLSFSKQSNQSITIYEILRSNGLPMGLLPKGVTNFTLDDSGRFEVHLDRACNSKFENEFHYDRNVSGRLSYGQIDGVSGISAQDLFLWFTVKEIRVDVPSSGLIYFDVGVVFKQFSLSSFDAPRDCLVSNVHNCNQFNTQIVHKSLSRKLKEPSMAVL